MNTVDEKIVIVLPLPNKCLSPNFPCASMRGRFMRAAAAKKQRRLAKEAAENASAGMKWEAATIKAVFYHAKERRRDDVNALAMLKSAYDGIVDSGIVPDDDSKHLKTIGAEFFIDRKCPRVEIFLTKQNLIAGAVGTDTNAGDRGVAAGETAFKETMTMTTCANWSCPDNENGRCYVGGCEEHRPLTTWEPERIVSDYCDDENENDNERNDDDEND